MGKTIFENPGANLAVDAIAKLYFAILDKEPQFRVHQHCVLGFMFLAYSRSFPYTIMFGQAFRLTGWPAVKEGFVELLELYAKGREQLRKEAPSVADARRISAEYKSNLARLQETFQEAKQSASLPGADAAHAASATAHAKNDIDKLHSSYQTAQATLSSVKAVALAVDPDRVATACSRIWLGMATCVVAAVSPSAQCMSVGLSVGDRIAAFTRALYVEYILKRKQREERGEPQDERGKRWEEFLFKVAFKCLGVLSAFYMQRVVNSFQGCMLGAHMMADAIAKTLRGRGIDLAPHVINALQLALCASGFIWQYKTPTSGRAPPLLRAFLMAPLALENLLSACASKSMWSEISS